MEEDGEFDNVDIYKYFSVESNSELSVIKKNYRKATLKCHPDHFPNDEAKKQEFMKLKRALDLLSDPNKRKIYDDKQRAKAIHSKRKMVATEESRRYKDKLDIRENEIKRQKTNLSAGDQHKINVVKVKEEALMRVQEVESHNKKKQLLEKKLRAELKKDQVPEIISERNDVQMKKISTQESYEDLIQSHNDFESQILAQMLGSK